MPSKERRLRVKVDKQAVRATGWAWFTIGILLALFFGGAVRALLSEKQVRLWMESTLAREAPPYDVIVERARIRLAEGIWPRLGLEVEGVEVVPKDLCRVPFRLKVGRLFLPVQVGQAVRGNLKFGVIRAQDLRVNRVTESCAKPNENPIPTVNPVTVLSPPPSPSVVGSSLQNFIRARWVKELKATERWLEGVEIQNVRVDGLPAPMDWAEILSLKLSLAQTSAELRATFRPGELWSEALDSPPFSLHLHLGEESGHGEVSVPLGEGKVVAQAEMDFANLAATGRTSFEFVPVSLVIEALRHWGVITDPLQPKRTWLTGQLTWQTKGLDFQDVQIAGENLKLAGDPGEVLITALRVFRHPLGWEMDPLVIQLKQFSLQHLLDFLGRKGYTGVIGAFGFLSGELKVKSPDEVQFGGRLEGLELNFSRRSVRARQKFKSFHGELALKDGRVSGLVKDFELENGVLKGLISINLDRHFLAGVFQVRLDEILFQPNVQRLMLGGEMAPMALFGQGRLEGGQVNFWSGELGTARIDAANWRVDTLKVHSEFAKGQMALSVRMLGAEVGESNFIWPQLKPLFLGYEKIGSPLRLRHLSGRLEIFAGGGRWRNTMATVKPGEVLLSSHGNWQGNLVEGLVSVDFPGVKMVRWELKGPWSNLEISPSARTARELRRLEN